LRAWEGGREGGGTYHEIAHVHLTQIDSVGCQDEGAYTTALHDGLLEDVEEGEGGAAGDAVLLVSLHGLEGGREGGREGGWGFEFMSARWQYRSLEDLNKNVVKRDAH